MSEPKPVWIGIVMAYENGDAVAVQMEGEDLIAAPVIEPLVADPKDDVIAFADLTRSFGSLLKGVSLHFGTRRLTAWYVGQAYAKAKLNRTGEITG